MYYKTKFGEIVKKVGEDYISVPMDETNNLYQDYIVYLENNGEVLDTDFVLNNFEEVPEKITAIQFFSQLLLEGITETAIRETIDYLVANEQLPLINGELAKIALRKATVFERNNPFISVIGLAFNKTSEQLDTIFINASKL